MEDGEFCLYQFSRILAKIRQCKVGHEVQKASPSWEEN